MKKCQYCANDHPNIICPRIKLIEYFPNGQQKRIELYPMSRSIPVEVKMPAQLDLKKWLSDHQD